MMKIDRARYGKKMLGMREKATEVNAKTHLKTELNLTKRALENMGIAQVFRLGKHTEKGSDIVPPVIIVFTTIDMVETVLNAARGEGLGRNFKEHIPEAYAKVYSNYIQIGIHLKETQQLNYRLKFQEHTLQLQVKAPSSDQYRVIKMYTPKAPKTHS